MALCCRTHKFPSIKLLCAPAKASGAAYLPASPLLLITLGLHFSEKEKLWNLMPSEVGKRFHFGVFGTPKYCVSLKPPSRKTDWKTRCRATSR